MTTQNSESSSTPIFSRHAAVLRWLEMQSLRENYARLQKPYRALDRDQRDRWWLAVGETEPPTGPHSFREALEHLLNGYSPVHVVHESRIGEEPTPWIALKCKPLWSDPKSVAWFRRSVIALEVIIAWFIFQSVIPWQLHHWSNWIFLAGVAGIFFWLHRRHRKQAAAAAASTADASPNLPPPPTPIETGEESPVRLPPPPIIETEEESRVLLSASHEPAK